MKRRELIAGIGGAATCFLWPRAAGAHQKQRIAFVHSGIPADQLTETAGPFWVRRFYETLRGLGHTEGANLVVERYSAEGGSERFAALAAAVVSSKPDVIVSNHNDLVKAFAAATATVPIVGITGSAGLAFREAGQHLGIALIVNFLPYVGEAQSAAASPI
jgi:putative ABC transport system substrate-binding protein